MCYLNQIKQRKTSTMLYLNYVKQNTTSVLCFSTHVNQNANNANNASLKSCTHKTIKIFSILINLSTSIKRNVLFESN